MLFDEPEMLLTSLTLRLGFPTVQTRILERPSKSHNPDVRTDFAYFDAGKAVLFVENSA